MLTRARSHKHAHTHTHRRYALHTVHLIHGRARFLMSSSDRYSLLIPHQIGIRLRSEKQFGLDNHLRVGPNFIRCLYNSSHIFHLLCAIVSIASAQLTQIGQQNVTCYVNSLIQKTYTHITSCCVDAMQGHHVGVKCAK